MQCSHSRGWCEFTGQIETQALRFGWLDAVHADDRERAERIFLAANQNHEPFALDYRLRRADGEYRWAEVMYRMSPDWTEMRQPR